MIDLDRSPARASAGLALVGGGVVVLLAGSASTYGGAIGALGWLASLGGIARRSSRWLSVGIGGFWLATVLASSAGLAIPGVLLAIVLAIVSWDAGRRAIDLGEGLTSAAVTYRVELLHAATTALVGTTGAALAFGLYALAPGRRAVPTVVFAFVATLLVVWSLR